MSRYDGRQEMRRHRHAPVDGHRSGPVTPCRRAARRGTGAPRRGRRPGRRACGRAPNRPPSIGALFGLRSHSSARAATGKEDLQRRVDAEEVRQPLEQVAIERRRPCPASTGRAWCGRRRAASSARRSTGPRHRRGERRCAAPRAAAFADVRSTAGVVGLRSALMRGLWCRSLRRIVASARRLVHWRTKVNHLSMDGQRADRGRDQRREPAQPRACVTPPSTTSVEPTT